jgi:hypothetical protein
MAISQPLSLKSKSKGTFFSSTFKVGDKKMPLVFLFKAQGLRYGHFLLCTIARW